MNRLIDATGELRRRGARGLIPFVTAGDGGFEVTLAVIDALAASGAAAIELGFPFSDPLADGPVLQAAAERALARGATFAGLLEVARAFRRHHTTPLVLMTYANPLFARGLERSTKDLASVGFDGLLAVDVPLEEDGTLGELCGTHNLARIQFTSPTSSDERLARAAARSLGFLYAIGRLGVTGGSAELDASTQAFLSRARAACTSVPLAVGFGISAADHVRAALLHADLAIVGSALVERIHASSPCNAPSSPQAAANAAGNFFAALKQGLPS